MKLLLVVMFAISLLCGVVFGQMNPASKGDAKETDLTMKGTTFVSGVSIPNTISYQGLLNTSSGYPVSDGSFELKFELFDVSVGGSAIWSETHSAVTVGRGTFSILLGSVTPFGPIFFQPLWVEVTAVSGPDISSPVLFSPRTQLTSSAYSLGPWQSSDGNYFVSKGSIGIGNPPTWGYKTVELFDSSTSAWFVAKSLGNYAGIAIDKPFDYYNGYVALLTNGVWKWSVGTKGSNDFSIYNWSAYQEYFHIDSLGNVGVGISAPTKKLDVNGPVQVKDTLFVGSSSMDGVVNVFQSGATEPTIKANKYPGGDGGQITLQDELGNPIVDLRPNGWGEGGGVRAYRTPTQVGFEGWGNWYGLGEGFAAVYGNNRSILFEPRFAGDASVQLPDSAISSSEILDEPGIARGGSGSTVVIARNTVVNVSIASITVPGPGYIVANGSTLAQFFGDTVGSMVGGIELANTTSPILSEAALVGSTNERLSASTNRWIMLQPTRTFYVSAAGTYTYYFNVARYSAYQAGTHTIYWPKLDLAYYPTSYGPVGAAIPEMEASAFANPLSESVSLPGDNSTGTKYTVDLRELELRAATARAKAEKAERELMEAKMNLQNGSQR